MSAPGPDSATPQHIQKVVKSLTLLSSSLPENIPVATRHDKICTAVPTVIENQGAAIFETFNRVTDILFKEDSDCRDEHGRFHYIRRGKLGMDNFCGYIGKINWEISNIPLDLVGMKLERILNELKYLTRLPHKKKAPFNDAKTKLLPKPKKRTKKMSGVTQDLINSAVNDLRGLTSKDGESANINSEDDTTFKPRKNMERDSSEDSIVSYTLDKDGLEVDDGNDAPKKRQRVISDTENEEDAVKKLPPRRMTKKAKKSISAAKSAEIKVIEVDDIPETSETEVKFNKKGPANHSRAHYRNPVPVVIQGVQRWEFSCKHCKKSVTVPRTVDKETQSFNDEHPKPALGNLATHLKKHPDLDLTAPSVVSNTSSELRGISAASAKVMEDYLKEGEINPALARTQKGFFSVFAAWILEDDLPFTTGETSGIGRLFKYIESRYMLPSDTTVRNYLAKIFCEMNEVVKSELESVKSKIAVSTDTWTTKSMIFTFAGTIASWVTDDWELIERVIDFHTIVEKEHEVTCNNAATNDVLLRTLSRLLISKFDIQFVPENAQIRCLAHVINLVVQKILATLGEAEHPEKNDYYETMKDLPVHYDADNDAAVQEMEHEAGEEENGDECDAFTVSAEDKEDHILLSGSIPSLSPLSKLRTTVAKILASPQRRAQFRKIALTMYRDEVKVPSKTDMSSSTTAASAPKVLVAHLLPIRDVRTRWNYTHAMIKRALILQNAINGWASLHGFSSLVLDRENWSYLEKLEAILEPFAQVTLQMSHSNTPTLPWVLPMYDFMDKHLSKITSDMNTLPSLQEAAAAGLQKLYKYHGKAQNCHYNIIATMLHPFLGIRFFRLVDASGDRAAKAQTIFKHALDRYKAAYENAPKSAVPLTRQSSASSSFLDEIAFFEDDSVNAEAAVPTTDEYEHFLQARQTFGCGEPNKPLLWWKNYGHNFPVISKMAKDFMAIPGTSVSVERLFSKSRHLCADLRSSLKAQTITESLLSKMWIRAGIFDRVLRQLA